MAEVTINDPDEEVYIDAKKYLHEVKNYLLPMNRTQIKRIKKTLVSYWVSRLSGDDTKADNIFQEGILEQFTHGAA